MIALALLAAVGLGAGVYFWVIPTAAELAAEQIAVSWEEKLGETVAASLTDSAPTCDDPAVTRAVDGIVARLAAAVPDNPYRFNVSVLRHDQMNAFAAPGGRIVIFSGLLRRTDNPEELAGVLAHEMSHVVRRHGTKALFRSVSTSIFISALFGDVSGAASIALDSAKTLGDLHYSRQAEEEADLHGLNLLLAAGIAPTGMLRFFEKLEDAEKKNRKADPQLLQYLSTHPLTTARIGKLKAARAASDKPFTPLPGTANWKTLAAACDPQTEK